MAFFTQKRQTLHDMMAGCIVLDTSLVPSPEKNPATNPAPATETGGSAHSTGTNTATPTESVSPVATTYRGNPASVSAQESTVIDEDAIYTAIAKELETGSTDKGLWTRLFAECDGDENRTKAAYIKQRAEKLISAERMHLQQAARECYRRGKSLKKSL